MITPSHNLDKSRLASGEWDGAGCTNTVRGRETELSQHRRGSLHNCESVSLDLLSNWYFQTSEITCWDSLQKTRAVIFQEGERETHLFQASESNSKKRGCCHNYTFI